MIENNFCKQKVNNVINHDIIKKLNVCSLLIDNIFSI